MKITSLAWTTGITISSMMASGAITPAIAITFDLGSFGEDISANGGANFTADKSSAAWNAERSFISKLSNPSTQNFDSDFRHFSTSQEFWCGYRSARTLNDRWYPARWYGRCAAQKEIKI